MPAAVGHPYVVKLKGVCGGEPVIKGTRIPVRIIAGCWRGGMSPEEIGTAYPHLELAQIFDALSYAEDHSREIDSLIKEERGTYRTGLATERKSAKPAKT